MHQMKAVTSLLFKSQFFETVSVFITVLQVVTLSCKILNDILSALKKWLLHKLLDIVNDEKS